LDNIPGHSFIGSDGALVKVARGICQHRELHNGFQPMAGQSPRYGRTFVIQRAPAGGQTGGTEAMMSPKGETNGATGGNEDLAAL